MKKLVVILLVLCLILPGCASGKEDYVSEEEAKNIVLQDLGRSADEVTFHIHISTDTIPAYYVYATVGNRTMEYVIRVVDGRILSVGESNHSH